MKVFAPGKIILSGEHAVVYGKPALAMAIDRYATASVTREHTPQVLFDLADIAHRSRLSIDALRHLKNRIKNKYHRFIQGDFSIREVLHKPFELAHFALGIFAESLNLSLPHGVKIHLQSDIPMGCGMGSSAATILSVIHAISHYLQIPMSQEALYQLALVAENMQHGQSSGLDLRVAINGGCLYVHGADITARALPTAPMYLINTGTPSSSTGQCVEKVAPLFRNSTIGDDFAAVTDLMDKALQHASTLDFQAAIKQNHQLLIDIGVVPEKVQQFATQIEAANGAAKICGAGAVVGENAGAVLVVSEDETKVAHLCEQFGYQYKALKGEARGLHVV